MGQLQFHLFSQHPFFITLPLCLFTHLSPQSLFSSHASFLDLEGSAATQKKLFLTTGMSEVGLTADPAVSYTFPDHRETQCFPRD